MSDRRQRRLSVRLKNLLPVASSSRSTIDAFESSAITNNTAGGQGGGLWATGSFQIQPTSSEDLEVSGNEAQTGGGLHLEPDSAHLAPVVRNVNIFDNDANLKGGGVHVGGCKGCDGELLIDDSHVTDNTADEGGGIAVTSSDAEVTIEDTHIERNVAAGEGGGLLVESGEVTLQSDGYMIGFNHLPTMVKENTAAGQGGGVRNYADLTLNRVMLEANDGVGAHEIANSGTLHADNVFVLGDGGQAIRTFNGATSDSSTSPSTGEPPA